MLTRRCQLIASITASSPQTMLADAEEALKRGADLVELRLDYLDDVAEQDLQSLVRPLGDKCIITVRPEDEGGRFDGSEADRLALLIKAGQGFIAFTDFEYSHLRRSAHIRLQAGLAGGRALILSVHDFSGRPAKLQSLIKEMVTDPDCLVVKAAWTARDATDNFEAFDLLRKVRGTKPIIALCMGEAGLPSRVLARKFGAFGTYCSLGPGRESAPGQPTLAEMRELYRWDRIDAKTEVYGVIGHPVAHSMSPAIFNAAFERAGLNAVYLPMPVRPTEDHFQDFIRHVLDRPWLDMRGLSVTLPHKEHAFRLCREALDDVSLRSGAVNTLTIVDGKIAGTNTDAAAAADALAAGMGCSREDLRGMNVDVLGAGGVARAVLAALNSCGCTITVYNRTMVRATKLAADFDCEAQPWDQRTNRRGHILVNCTSLGMWPNTGETPIPESALSGDLTVFDTVYNPPQTRVLADARARGCRTVSGLDMFIRQAAAQFEAWTGRPAPRDVMEKVARSRLGDAGAGPAKDTPRTQDRSDQAH